MTAVACRAAARSLSVIVRGSLGCLRGSRTQSSGRPKARDAASKSEIVPTPNAWVHDRNGAKPYRSIDWITCKDRRATANNFNGQ
jgi:hypothetical protein